MDQIRALAAIVDALDGPDFPDALRRALSAVVPFELLTGLVYRGRSRPVAVYDNFPTNRAKQGIANYVNRAYVLNPFYQAYRRGLEPGVYRISDLAPDGFFESGYDETLRVRMNADEEIGFITDNWPTGMAEVNIAVTLEDGGAMAEIGLYQPLTKGGFDEAALSMLAMIEPVISAAVRKFWARYGHAVESAHPDTRIDEAFERFGEPDLTEREREVVQLVLRGHSSESIGGRLDISITTVKTHRRNAYAKLQISSQSELLSLFLNSLEA